MRKLKNMSILTLFLACMISIQGCAEKESPLEDGTNTPGQEEQSAGSDLFQSLDKPLSSDLFYSSTVKLPRNAIIQNFDIARNGDVFYLQIAGSSQEQLNLVRGNRKDRNPKEMMVLEYFGHGTNLAIEEISDQEIYAWLGSYGNKGSDGAYGGSQVISRIRFQPGTTVRSCVNDAPGEHFYLPGERNIHPAINLEKDLLGVEYTVRINGYQRRCFKVWKLSEVMKAVPEPMQLKDVCHYGGENNTNSFSERPELQARDLSKLKPLYEINVIENPKTPSKIGGLPFQGFDIDEKGIYYYEGCANDNDLKKTSVAYVSRIGTDGKVQDRKLVKAIISNQNLKKLGLADRGYAEAEGIKVKGKDLYLGFATRKIISGTDTRLANIFKYNQ